MRAVLERRWRNGIGLKRIMIAGTSDVARHVVDRMLQHSELGYRIVGLVGSLPATVALDIAAAGGSVSGPASPASVSAARFSGFSDSDIFNLRVSCEIRHKPRSGTIPGNLSMPSHGVIPITGAGAFRVFRYQAFSFRDSFSILA